jgi:hypothetical protein
MKPDAEALKFQIGRGHWLTVEDRTKVLLECVHSPGGGPPLDVTATEIGKLVLEALAKERP